jgi:hypothetical protein
MNNKEPLERKQEWNRCSTFLMGVLPFLEESEGFTPLTGRSSSITMAFAKMLDRKILET